MNRVAFAFFIFHFLSDLKVDKLENKRWKEQKNHCEKLMK